jgi:hypothetical protein
MLHVFHASNNIGAGKFNSSESGRDSHAEALLEGGLGIKMGNCEV